MIYILMDPVGVPMHAYSTQEAAQTALNEKYPIFNTIEEAEAYDEAFANPLEYTSLEEINDEQILIKDGHDIVECELD